MRPTDHVSQKCWHKQLLVSALKDIRAVASCRRRTLTSISKSGSRNAVLKSEQKWATAGTSHQDWTSSTDTVHPWDILGPVKVCAAPSSHRRVVSSVTQNASGTLQTSRKLSLPSCWSCCHCDQRSGEICFNLRVSPEQSGRDGRYHPGTNSGGESMSQRSLINYTQGYGVTTLSVCVRI